MIMINKITTTMMMMMTMVVVVMMTKLLKSLSSELAVTVTVVLRVAGPRGPHTKLTATVGNTMISTHWLNQ